MSVKWYPVEDGLALLVVLVIDMTKPFFPCIQPFALEFDNLSTESTPEFTLSVPSDSVPLALSLDVFIVCNLVLFAEMSLELFTPVEYAGTPTNRTRFGNLMAAPGLDLVMLRILVAFPIVLAPKLLEAAWKRATIGAGVPFPMFPEILISY